MELTGIFAIFANSLSLPMLILFVVLCLASSVILMVGRQIIPIWMRVMLYVVIGICLLMLVFAIVLALTISGA